MKNFQQLFNNKILRSKVFTKIFLRFLHMHEKKGVWILHLFFQKTTKKLAFFAKIL